MLPGLNHKNLPQHTLYFEASCADDAIAAIAMLDLSKAKRHPAMVTSPFPQRYVSSTWKNEDRLFAKPSWQPEFSIQATWRLTCQNKHTGHYESGQRTVIQAAPASPSVCVKRYIAERLIFEIVEIDATG